MQKQRLKMLSQGCEALRQSGRRFKPYHQNYYVDDAKTVAFCPMPKTASTWWLKVFLQANGVYREDMEEVIES